MEPEIPPPVAVLNKDVTRLKVIKPSKLMILLTEMRQKLVMIYYLVNELIDCEKDCSQKYILSPPSRTQNARTMMRKALMVQYTNCPKCIFYSDPQMTKRDDKNYWNIFWNLRYSLLSRSLREKILYETWYMELPSEGS